MKGEIFSIFEKFIEKNFGQGVYEDALSRAAPEFSTKEPFVGPEVYPDSDFMALFGRTLEIVQVPVHKALWLFGRFAFRRLAASIPHLMPRYSSSVELLRELDGIIHVEVRKLSRGTAPPRFTFQEQQDGRIALVYDSPRRLYDLAEGLLVGLADYFGEEVSVEREVHEDGKCTFWLSYGQK